MHVRVCLFALGIMLVGTALAPAPSAAAPTITVTVPALQKMVADMGLADAGDKTSYVRIEKQGKDNISIDLYPVEDGAFVSVLIALGSVPVNKVADMPATKMLEYNDTATFYFSFDTDKGLYLQARLKSATIDPQVLRQQFDALIAAVDDTRDLWDQDKWTASTGTPAAACGAGATLADSSKGKTYQRLMDAANDAWEKAPMAIKTALFAKDKVAGFRDYQTRDSSVFKTRDVVHAYVEPIFFTWKPVGDQQVVDLSADILLETVAGDSVIDAKRAVNLKQGFPEKFKNVDLVADLTLGDSLPATNYVLTITVHDNNSTKVVVAAMPFSLSNSK